MGALIALVDGIKAESARNTGKFEDVKKVAERDGEGTGSPCIEPSPTDRDITFIEEE